MPKSNDSSFQKEMPEPPNKEAPESPKQSDERLPAKKPAHSRPTGDCRVRFRKAPGAPRRFKSSYMFFSTERHKSIREGLEKEGRKEKVKVLVTLFAFRSYSRCLRTGTHSCASTISCIIDDGYCQDGCNRMEGNDTRRAETMG